MECPMIIDTHVHGRIGAMMVAVVRIIVQFCQAAIFQPNVQLPGVDHFGIRTAADANFYRELISVLAAAFGYPDFRPLTSILLTDNTDYNDVPFWRGAGVVEGKGYPGGLYGDWGVNDYRNLDSTFRAMYEYRIPAKWHFERPEVHPLFAEQAATEDFRLLADRNDVRVVFAHGSSATGLAAVREYYPHAIAEITPQHLLSTADDVYDPTREKIIYPHNSCKPPAKTPEDREACIQAAIDWAIYGGDCAFHLARSDDSPSKASDPPAAGCANYPAGPSVVAKAFADRGSLDKFPEFMGKRAAEWYGLELSSTSSLVIEDVPWIVPPEIPVSLGKIVVPWLAGVTIPWQVVAA